MSMPPDPRLGTAGATVASLLFHGLLYLLVLTYGTIPELDFEFEMPTEIELGMTDAMSASAGAFDAPVETPTEESDATEEGEGEAAGEERPDAGPPRPDLGPPDAGVPDAGPLVAEAESEGEDDTTLPAGAQIAIRIDMARVRDSALSDDVRRLMAAIPDWQLLLEGSGLDPIADLDRLLIASPNMQRSQMVLAGRHAHADEGVDFIRAVVARFAEARGTSATWTERHGVPVAPWPNEDATERVVAIVGPLHFIIARPQDLPTILAITVAREAAADSDLEEASGADALLSMGEGEAFSVEVEGARNFVRGRLQHIPERLRLAVTEEPGRAVLTGRARFEDDATAEAAASHWEGERARFARTPFVGGYVRELELGSDGRFVTIGHRLTLGQARMLLSFLEGAVSRPRNRSRRSSAMSETAMDDAPDPSD